MDQNLSNIYRINAQPLNIHFLNLITVKWKHVCIAVLTGDIDNEESASYKDDSKQLNHYLKVKSIKCWILIFGRPIDNGSHSCIVDLCFPF